jgi:hypothetical protein
VRRTLWAGPTVSPGGPAGLGRVLRDALYRDGAGER